MRKTLWTLALCGFASASYVQAQNRTLAPAEESRPSVAAPARPVDKATKLKNYSAELFGEKKAVEPAEEAPLVAKKPAPVAPQPPAMDAAVADREVATDAPEGRVTVTRRAASESVAGKVPVAKGAAAPQKSAPPTPASEGRPAWADNSSEPDIVSADAAADKEITEKEITLVKSEAAPAAKARAVPTRAVPAREVPAREVPAATEAPSAAKVTKAPVKTPTTTRRIEAPVDVATVDEAEEAIAPAPPVTPRSRITTTRQAVRQVSGTSTTKPSVADPAKTAFGADTVVATKAPAAGPQVVTEWRATGAINVGQESTCDLVIKNTGNATAAKVEVEASFPKGVRLVSSQPEPDSKSDLAWTLDELAAGEEQVIHLTFIPESRGSVTPEASVRFSGLSSGSFSVAEPLLAVRLEGASEVMVGEPASQTLMISNPGTGIVTNVKIEALIPAGLEHARGAKLKMDLGNLAPGENRPVRLHLTAVGGGRQVIDVHATADSGLVESASSEVTVIAPSLAASIEGPSLRYLGRQATYKLSVVNDGAAATDNVRVMYKVPEGFEFVSGERGVQYDDQNRMLNWFVGRLDRGADATVPVIMTAKTAGEFTHFIRATSEHGAISDAEVSTRVEGASSLVVEVSDLDDPVEVGVETAYEIKVKNEGTATAKNVSLTCELPAGVEFMTATGPEKHSHEKDLVNFESIGELAVGQSVTFQVKVKGTLSGNMRFRTRLTSDSLAEPLASEELTKVYGE